MPSSMRPTPGRRQSRDGFGDWRISDPAGVPTAGAVPSCQGSPLKVLSVHVESEPAAE